MSVPTETKTWILSKKPMDMPVLSGSEQTFTLKTEKLASVGGDQVLVKAVYYSNDPAQRGWISASMPADRLYVKPVPVGGTMHARAIAQVVDLGSDAASSGKLKKGGYVTCSTGWSEYSVLNAKECLPIQELPGVSLSHYLGALGTTGLTAYYGTVEVAKTTADDSIVVSGAAGATGSMVVQIAKKMIGCKRVIGIAGSAQKCKWVESLGADVCINYKDKDFKDQLIAATDGFVEVYFDNVGGEILDLMLTRMKRYGRIAACGAISNYNNESAPTGLKNYFEVISNRLNIQGFIVLDYISKAGEIVQKFIAATKEGKIKVSDDMETVVESSFEDVPKTWMKLFEGGNQGKLVTKLTSSSSSSSL